MTTAEGPADQLTDFRIRLPKIAAVRTMVAKTLEVDSPGRTLLCRSSPAGPAEGYEARSGYFLFN
jgi:hypothetical protein